jgi:hypothetical protein
MALKTSYSDTFNCSPRELWPWIDDEKKLSQWVKGPEEWRPVSSGPKRVGYQAKAYIREGGKLAEYDTTLLAYEPNERLRMELVGGCGNGMKVVVDYVLVDLRNGRTRLDYEFEITSSSVILRILGRLLLFMGRMQLKRFFKKLEQLVEGGTVARVH